MFKNRIKNKRKKNILFYNKMKKTKPFDFLNLFTLEVKCVCVCLFS